jgi:hypothetical protein
MDLTYQPASPDQFVNLIDAEGQHIRVNARFMTIAEQSRARVRVEEKYQLRGDETDYTQIISIGGRRSGKTVPTEAPETEP